MRIKEIVEAMTAVGRTETYNGVSVYLDTLLKRAGSSESVEAAMLPQSPR